MNVTAGDIYSVEWDDDGSFNVAKVLVVDESAVHLRIYKEKFGARPISVDPESLSLGSIDDDDGFGIGHIPITLEELELWHPEKITSREVTEDELDGYVMWKDEADAGVFGSPPTFRDRLRGWLGRR